MSALAGGSRRAQAFAMSLGAGLATGIGATFVLCTGSLNRRLLACTMSFSAGVMVYVSFVEVISVSNEYFGKGYPPAVAYAFATLSFFAGVLIMAVVDAIVHRMFDAISGEHSHASGEAHGSGGSGSAQHAHVLVGGAEGGAEGDEESLCGVRDDAELFEDEGGSSIRALAHVRERKRLLMMSAVVCTAIVLHNIPEGMATCDANGLRTSASMAPSPLLHALACRAPAAQVCRVLPLGLRRRATCDRHRHP